MTPDMVSARGAVRDRQTQNQSTELEHGAGIGAPNAIADTLDG